MEHVFNAQQVIAFQKTLFDNGINAVNMFQDHTEKITTTFVNQLPGMTEAGKKTFEESLKTCKKVRDDFKKSVDEGFDNLEKMFAPPQTHAQKKG
jgi:hypothetical protein